MTILSTYLTVSEAAALVGVSVPAVNARIASGKLPVVQDPEHRARTVWRADVELWIVERATKAMAVVRAAAALP